MTSDDSAAPEKPLESGMGMNAGGSKKTISSASSNAPASTTVQEEIEWLYKDPNGNVQG